MAIRQGNTDSIEAVRDRLRALFPGDVSEVDRQVDVAISCAEHLGITVTPGLIENLVTEHLSARAVSNPVLRRTAPAVPLICRAPDAVG